MSKTLVFAISCKWFNHYKRYIEQNSKESTKKPPGFQHLISEKLFLQVFMAAYENIGS